MPIEREMTVIPVKLWSQAISSNFNCIFRSKIAKLAKDKCSHCAMDLEYCFRLLSTVPSHIITAFIHLEEKLLRFYYRWNYSGTRL